MALTTVTLHGQILAPVTNTPAIGTVTFKILQELRDNLDNVIYSPQTFNVTLDVAGEFSIVLPVTDDPNVTPLNWSYWVYVDTDVWTSDVFYIPLPTLMGPVVEFADLLPMSTSGLGCTPDGSACAPIGSIGALQAEIDALQVEVDALEAAITGFQDQIDDLNNRVDDVEGDITVIQGQITTLQGQITTIQGQIATLDATVSALVGQVNTISPIVFANQADIATINGQIATIQGQITTINGQITTLQGQVATNTVDIATINGQITTINGQITTIQGQIATLQTDLANLAANTVLRNPVSGAVYVGNQVIGPQATGTMPWLSTSSNPIPYSPGDTNFDFVRIVAIDEFGNQVTTFTLNGNGEKRSRPSSRSRIADRSFESAEAVGYSTGQFWQASSNPTVVANRKPYLGVWGTAAAKPGWAEATEVLSGLKGVSIGGDTTTAPFTSLSAFVYRGLKATPGAPTTGTWAVNDVVLDSIGVVWRCTVAGTPGTWVAAVNGTPLAVAYTGTMGNAATISDGTGTGAPYAVTTTYNQADNRVYFDGAMANNGGVSIPGGTVLFTVNALHAPAAWVQCNERTSTTLSARVTVRPDGTCRLDQAMAAGATLSLDGFNYRKS